jgi:deazaflavin-dependent oxidoreductase (nitroreductase family)
MLSAKSYLERLIYAFASSRVGGWVFAPTLHLVDRFVFRVSNGRAFATSALTRLPIVMLTTTGAKTGAPRTVPLVGIRDGDKVVLIASNYGNTRHPAWYHNLCAHPEATLSLDGVTKTYTARQAEPPEYDRYWDRAVALYVGYAAYKSRTRGRIIPIMVLTPR